ncbi:MAG: SpvB/TcaC N-terminal domain-containing protein, partial [Planctomycetota bacterium]
MRRSAREGVPAYDDSVDEFEINGERLLPSSDPTQPNRFHTYRESFSRIERVGDAWEVRSPSGTVSRYGISDNSRVTNPNDGAVLSWHLAEHEDTFGNIIQYVYSEATPGRRHLSEIRYTLRKSGSTLVSLSGAAAPDDTIDRVIRFHLQDRPDKKLSYRNGFAQELNHRLWRIDVESEGGLIRRYELSYETSPDSHASLLSAVSHYGADADEPSPTAPHVESFTYQSNVTLGREGWGSADPDTGVPGSTWMIPSSLSSRNGIVTSRYRDGGVRFADLNGDGRTDLIREVRWQEDPENEPYSGAWLNSATGYVLAPEFRFPMSANHPYRLAIVNTRDTSPWRNDSEGVRLVDLNRDGRADILRLMYGKRWVAPFNYETFADHELYYRTDNGWELEAAAYNPPGTPIDQVQGWVSEPFHSFAYRVGDDSVLYEWPHNGLGLSVTMDLNGDGRPDLLADSAEVKIGQNLLAESYVFHRKFVLQSRDGSGFGVPSVGPYAMGCS